MSDNIVQAVEPGVYRNHAGAVLHVLNYIESRERWQVHYLGPGAALAESRDPLFGPTLYVVSAYSLAQAGYEIDAAGGAP